MQQGAHGLSSTAMVLALVGLVASMSGCGVTTLPVNDNESPTASVRAVFRPPGKAGAERAGPGVEFGYEGYRAKDTRVLATNEIYSLGGVDVTGPDTLRQQLDVRRVHVAYTHLLRFGQLFELEPFVGAARTKVHLTAEPVTSALRPTANDLRTEVIGGITPRWRLNEWLAVELRLTATRGDGVDSFSSDAGLLLSPVPTLALRLGYSQRAQTYYDNRSFSRVEADVRGPSATLQFEF